jgi:hypothetical protein
MQQRMLVAGTLGVEKLRESVLSMVLRSRRTPGAANFSVPTPYTPDGCVADFPALAQPTCGPAHDDKSGCEAKHACLQS